MTKLKVNGETLWVEDRAGGEPALLFVHGNSLTSETWRHQVETDELSRWRRIVLDLPGHGRSARSAEPAHRYSMLGYAEIVAGLVRTLNLHRIVLVGHSLGGHIALEAAPDVSKLSGLFAFGMGPVTSIEDMPRVFQPNPVLEFLSEGQLTAEQAAAWAEALVKERDRVPPSATDWIRSVDPAARPAFMASAAAGRHRNEVAVARDLACPLAMAHGTADALVELGYIESLNLPLWRGGVHIVTDAGHSPQWEQPARFNALLREFVESLA